MRALHGTRRTGMTLVELIIVIALLGLTAVLAGYTGHARVDTVSQPDPFADSLLAARRRALYAGARVTVHVLLDSSVRTISAWPDGQVFADDARVDRLIGRIDVNAR